jgi:hypothetical protein
MTKASARSHVGRESQFADVNEFGLDPAALGDLAVDEARDVLAHTSAPGGAEDDRDEEGFVFRHGADLSRGNHERPCVYSRAP